MELIAIQKSKYTTN